MRDRVSVSEVRVRGPLADYAPGFAEFLAGQRYAARSARLQLHLVAQLSRWLDAEGIGAAGLTELEAERFLAARRARVVRLFRSRRALDPVISYVRGLGVAPVPIAVALTPLEALLERYRRYLLVERTVAVASGQEAWGSRFRAGPSGRRARNVRTRAASAPPRLDAPKSRELSPAFGQSEPRSPALLLG